jgi:hypothetical protein
MERAAWIPGWYELDQPLEVGDEGEYAFWRVVPAHLQGRERLVFYNTLWNEKDAIWATGKIIRIYHQELGEVRKVDTEGLDYTIIMADGVELLVNAEEKPGKIYEGKPGAWIESKRVVSEWRFEVQFESLSIRNVSLMVSA